MQVLLWVKIGYFRRKTRSKRCRTGSTYRQQQMFKMLMSHPVSISQFDKSGAHIFTLFKCDFLLVVDYFSNFPFVFELYDKAVFSVITSLKSLYSIHSMPQTLFADNMPFASQKMLEFVATLGFEMSPVHQNFHNE